MKEKKFKNKNSRGRTEPGQSRARRRTEPADRAQTSGHTGRSDLLIGRNPVTEALRSGRPVDRILVQEGSGGSIGKIFSLAKERGIRIEQADKARLDRIAGGGAHQGVAAFVSAREYAAVDDILALAEERNEKPFVIALDGVKDPHNLGAIMRTAECAGAHGVIISRHRAAGLTETVAKASAGAVEYLLCARVANMARTIEELKTKGLWAYACDMDGDLYSRADMSGAAVIVIGEEGSGISRLVREKCDFTVSIPMLGRISSLNASNAAAILMYEIRRQRDKNHE